MYKHKQRRKANSKSMCKKLTIHKTHIYGTVKINYKFNKQNNKKAHKHTFNVTFFLFSYLLIL